MKISFGIKFGALMLIAIMPLVGSILVFFHQESMDTMKTDLKDRIGDVARTSAFILDEEDRLLIGNFRDQIYARLPADYKETVQTFERLTQGGEELQGNVDKLFSMDASSDIQNEYDFQYIVQLHVGIVAEPDFNLRLVPDDAFALGRNAWLARGEQIPHLHAPIKLL